MRGATLFTGIAAPETADPSIDWIWCAEISKPACAVLKARHPHIPNLGDVTHEHFIENARRFGPVDIVVAGSPCQDFSVAGRRAGMDGARGSLALRLVEVLGALRPRWLLFENVPGLLISASHAPENPRLVEGICSYEADEGSDFGALLSALSELGYHLAYASMDAQFFGLAQRRERLFAVGYLGDWRRSAAVLFDAESLQGNPPPSRQTGQGIAGSLASRASAGGGLGTDFELGGGIQIAPGIAERQSPGGQRHLHPDDLLLSQRGGQRRIDGESETFVAHALRADGFDASEDGTGRGTPLVPIISPTLRSGGNRTGDDVDPMFTLQSGKQHAVAFNGRQDQDISGSVTHPLDTDGHSNAVAFQSSQSGVREGEMHPTLDSHNGSRRHNGVIQGMAVRRLMPRECERLQGFKDDYTLVPYRGKLMADGPRYQMLGNSMPVPVMRWLLERIRAVDALSVPSRPL